MIRTVLLAAAVVIFAALGLDLIDTVNAFRWEMAGLALAFAGLLPWPR